MAVAVAGAWRFKSRCGRGCLKSVLARIQLLTTLMLYSFLAAISAAHIQPATSTMIIRSVTRCSPRRLQICRPRVFQTKPRRFSTSSASLATGHSSPPASMLGAFTNELDKIAPKFEIHGSQIQVLRTPAEFYETLKVRQKLQ